MATTTTKRTRRGYCWACKRRTTNTVQGIFRRRYLCAWGHGCQR